jgi:hypothetical protein
MGRIQRTPRADQDLEGSGSSSRKTTRLPRIAGLTPSKKKSGFSPTIR